MIDPASRQVLTDQSVFLADDRIRAVQSAGGRSRFVVADTIDGTGRFLIPGLIDSHAHVGRDMETIEATFALMLANGVTGVRAFGAHCWDPGPDRICLDGLRAIAAEVDAGVREGPRLLSMTSDQVNGALQRRRMPDSLPAIFTPGTAEEGRALPRYLQGRGVDVIKVYSWLGRTAYFAMIDEASSLGIEVSGHLPAGVSIVEASNSGQRTIEHADALAVDCSTFGPEYWARMNDAIEGVDPTGVPWEEGRRILDGFDAERCDEVLPTLVANGTYLVPTHGTRETRARAGEEEFRDDPRLKYVSAQARQWWFDFLDQAAGLSPEAVALFREDYPHGLRLTVRAHAAGVKVLIGTDANSPMIFPGFSVHDELRRFADAGIAPMDVLRAATTVPAEYLGRTEDLGGVSAGKLADLVLLDADPLIDIRNTARINAVVRAGRVYDRAALDGLLRGVEIRMASSEASSRRP